MFAHRLLGGGGSCLSISCPSLGSTLIVVARARLGAPLSSTLNPLSSHTRKQRGKKKSLASAAGPDFFPDSLLASCGSLAPFRLCSRHQPQFCPWDPTSEAQASAPSPHPFRRVSRQASRAGECWSAPILCVGISLLCPPHRCCCTLLRSSDASPLCHPQSPPMKGLPSVCKPFLLHSSLPLVQVPSLFFCLCSFFFLLPYPGTWGSFLPFGRSEVFCQRSVSVL